MSSETEESGSLILSACNAKPEVNIFILTSVFIMKLDKLLLKDLYVFMFFQAIHAI